MMCGVCSQVLHRAPGKGWLHNLDIIGKVDHPTVAVPYDETRVVSQCDFCGGNVALKDRWFLDAEDFTTLVIEGGPKNISQGGWGCCSDCAPDVKKRDWDSVIKRHMATVGQHYGDDLAPFFAGVFLPLLLTDLENHIKAPLRRWQAGDEQSQPS